MTSNDYILLGALAGVVVMLVGYAIGRIEKAQRGIPHFKYTPPPPPEPRVWYRLLAHELQQGEIYRHRLTQCRVQVTKPAEPPENGRRFYARGVQSNPKTLERIPIYISDGDLETDDPMLDPKERQRILRLDRKPTPFMSDAYVPE